MNEQELKEIEDWNNKICICCESSKCCDRSKVIPKLITEIRRLQHGLEAVQPLIEQDEARQGAEAALTDLHADMY